MALIYRYIANFVINAKKCRKIKLTKIFRYNGLRSISEKIMQKNNFLNHLSLLLYYRDTFAF